MEELMRMQEGSVDAGVQLRRLSLASELRNQGWSCTYQRSVAIAKAE
jgi:hypothetical protein